MKKDPICPTTHKSARLIWVFIVLGIYNFAFKQDIFYHLVKTTQELFSFQQSRLDKQFPFHYAKIEKCINSWFFLKFSFEILNDMNFWQLWFFLSHWKQMTSCKRSFVNRKCTKTTNCSMNCPFLSMRWKMSKI